MSYSLWNGDLHTHTNLSLCAPASTVPASYLPYCQQEDIQVLGFSNHLYYKEWNLLGQTGDQMGVNRVLRLAPQLAETQKQTDMKLLFGCEVEVIYGKEPALAPADATPFDYVLIAASHILNIPHEYDTRELQDADKLRERTLERFLFACSLDYPVPVGICHPLYPICSPVEQQVVDGISDSQLAECFSLAAKKNISIEIHACLYRKGTALNEEGLSPSYLRVLSAAKACGCKFHFGADAHAPEAFTGVHNKLRLAARRAGITPEDMWQLPALK